MGYFICKVCITLYVKYLFSAQNLNQMSTIFLVPTGTAAPCRRREPPVLAGEDAGGELAVHHTTKYNRAATPQDLAQLRLDEAMCHGTHPTRRLRAVHPKPATHVAGRGLVPVGTKTVVEPINIGRRTGVLRKAIMHCK